MDVPEILKQLVGEVRKKKGSSEALRFHVHLIQPIIKYFKEIDNIEDYDYSPLLNLLDDFEDYPKSDFVYETYDNIGVVPQLTITHIPTGTVKKEEIIRRKAFFKQRELLYLELVIELIKKGI